MATLKIRRQEGYTENMENHYKLPNTTTMESLQIKVSAGEGAVLKMGDKVLVTDHAWKGFIAAAYLSLGLIPIAMIGFVGAVLYFYRTKAEVA